MPCRPKLAGTAKGSAMIRNKGLLWAVFGLIAWRIPATAQVQFSKPTEVLSVSEGSDESALGWWCPDQAKGEEGDYVCPSDFALSTDGGFWIMDDAKHRVARYSADGRFQFAWSGASRELRPGASLEGTQDGGIVVLVKTAPGEHDYEAVTLDQFGAVTGRAAFKYQRGTDMVLQAAGNGALYVVGADSPLLVNTQTGEQHTLRDLCEVHASPYLAIALASPRRRMTDFSFSRIAGAADEANRTAVVLRVNPGALAEVVAIGPRGEAFVMEKSIGAGGIVASASVRMYGVDGDLMAEVPDCPKPVLAAAAATDLFEAGPKGDLYEMEVTKRWDRPSQKGYVRIWKWTQR
jgi:hypothetical protein